jgi:hypothetical protein
MKKPFEEIDENTIQKHTNEEYPYAIGYSPEDDLIVIYNYDTNDILLSFAGVGFSEQTDITDAVFETIKEENIPGINDELLEEYHDIMTSIKIGTITMDYDPDELDEEIIFLEKCLMDEAYKFQFGFNFGKLLEDVEKSIERYHSEDSEDSEEESRGIGR